jgi:predicted RNA binding protein YcfA (HicA-like mRNA interferase family)
MNDVKLPILKAVELIKALEKLGFVCTRKSKGSHFRYKHPDGRKTTFPGSASGTYLSYLSNLDEMGCRF